MELPNGFMPMSHEQECAILSAVHQVNEEEGYELEDATQLAFDLLRKLHELGYYLERSGVSVEDTKDNNPE